MISTAKKISSIYIVLFSTFLFSQSSDLEWVEKNESTNYTARHEFGFTQAGDKFIMFGGRESPKRLDVYDYASNTWSRGEDAPENFNHFQAVFYEGLVWVIGAFKNNSFPNETSADYIYMYNPASEQWIQGMEIPQSRKRGAGGLVVYNNKFYLVGGNNQGHSGGYIDYFDEFDPYTGSWTILADAPHERDHFHAVVNNDKLYVVAGRLSDNANGFTPDVPEVDIYDFNTSTWSTLNSSSNIPTPRSGVGVVLLENEIFVIGGEGDIIFNTVEAFNTTTNTWSAKSNLNNARHGIQALVSNNTIYVAGGRSDFVSLREMEYYGEFDNPTGNANVTSTFSPDQDTKIFNYTEDQAQVTIDILLSNVQGTTGTFIDSIEVTGNNFSLIGSYENILLGANNSMTIQVLLSDTSALESIGNVEVIYNNTSSLNISLEGTQEDTFSTNENTINDFKIYPSIASSSFKINKNVSVLNIYDIYEKLVASYKGDFNTNISFNISSLSNGLYFIEAYNKFGEKTMLKFIKK